MNKHFLRIITLIMVVLMCVISLVACDDEGSYKNPSNEGENLTETQEALKPTEGLRFSLSQGGEAYYVSDVQSWTETIVIPSTYNGKPVTGIGSKAFWLSAECKKMVIPDSVIWISSEAFYEYNMEAIQREGDVSYIDKWIINCDKNVINVTLRANTVGIADQAFRNCNDLLSINIPKGVKYIGSNSFEGCDSLQNVSLPKGLKSIGFSAFNDCPLSNIILPEGLETIGSSAFDCLNLKSITIPKSVKSIGSNAFWFVETVTYNGTKAEWDSMTIEEDAFKPGVSICCTDGNFVFSK